MTEALLVALGAAVGAPVRYLADLAVRSRSDSVFPWGTLIVNVVGSSLLGVVAAAVAAAPSSRSPLMVLAGTGFCGALTTFSTFSYETVRLLEDGAWSAATVNVTAGLTAGLLGCLGGFAAAGAVL